MIPSANTSARASGLAPRLLRRHVRELALERARRREACLPHRPRDAEVGELHLALERHEHVVQRDVAMDEAERAAATLMRCAYASAFAISAPAHGARRQAEPRLALSRARRRGRGGDRARGSIAM